jgi:uncharacterized hydrophobic protein (TIGR00271 family)
VPTRVLIRWETTGVLHLQLRVPSELTDRVVALLADDDTVTNVAVIPDGFAKPAGCLVLADVAREGANAVVTELRDLGIDKEGSIAVSEPEALLSDEADRAELAAPGRPDDAVVWDVVESRLWADSRLSWAFLSFLTLATLIAGIGRLLDEPILIIGAMVVGPEFSPVAAICLALARPRLSLLPQAVGTLVTGFAVAMLLATLLWWLGSVLGHVSAADASNGPATAFIVHPDGWSLAVAVLAGIAGVLSLTTDKSGPLVGVFISVTTVPSVGTAALCLGAGAWSQVGGAGLQLGLNLAGMVVAGTTTLVIQRLVWGRVVRPRRMGTL